MKKPSQIVSDCFNPAVDLALSIAAENMPNLGDDRASIFHQYAIFAERQYHAISRSPDALRWKLYVDRKKEEIAQRQEQIGKLSSQAKEYQTLCHELRKAQQLLKQDEDRYREQSGQRTSFLALAVKMYAQCLATSDKFDDDSPVRLCSLWLANFESDDAKLKFGRAVQLVPSHKFVFLAHQLTARLSKSASSSSSPNQLALQRVIRRMGREHPFHSLFPLYCLRLETSSSQASGRSKRQSGRHATPASSQLERAAAVSDVFDKIRSDPNAGERVKAVEHVCDASLQWAKYPIKPLYDKKSNSKDLPVPDHLLVRRLKDVPVPVITASTPIDPTTEYRDCVWISYYDAQFSTAGGVNLPKITVCHGSDGRSYKQLVRSLYSLWRDTCSIMDSLREREKMTFVKTLSWSKSLIWSTSSSVMIAKPGRGNFRCEGTRSYRWLHKPGYSSSLTIQHPLPAGSSQHTLGEPNQVHAP